jgi:hypothetical protein
MMPPAATAATTAAEVQLAAVPEPTIRVGCEVSAARASAGTGAWPPGLPFAGTTVEASGDGLAALGDGVAGDAAFAALPEGAGARQAALAAVPPHPASRQQASWPATIAAVRLGATAHRLSCSGGLWGLQLTVTTWAVTAGVGAAA